MLANMQSDVAAFHKFFGLSPNTVPTDIPQDRRLLRRSLIAEENSELWIAVSRFDMIETADAICDLLYVTLGTRVEFGLSPPPASFALNVSPTIAFPDTDKLRSFKDAITRRMQTLSVALSVTLPDGYAPLGAIDDATFTVARSLCGFSAALGIPVIQCWNEVHRSNMTKAESDRHAEDCPLSWDAGKCTCVAILYREDGKILKGRHFRPPDLKAILEAAGYKRLVALRDDGAPLVAGL